MAENNFAQNATTDIVIDALMGVTDPAAIATDILLDQLIDALVSHYTIAAADIEKKSNNYFSKFKDADAKKRADVEAGKLSKDDYKKWRVQKMLTGDHYNDLKNVLVSDMNNANQIAADIINNKKPDVYALNHNYGVYEIEHSTGLATSYVMYDHDTVENLIAENPQILPKNKIDIPADKKWNMQKINNALTQGVLQGESIPDISKRLRDVTDMNKNAAIRNARTAMTGAQNAGRDDSYRRAESMGIPVDQIWISTLDGRTRHSHRAMMGEVRKGKTFSNGLRYPGDPWGAGEEVYNCRCTMIANVNDVDYGIEDMVNSKLKEKGMTWDEWVNEQPLSKHNGESKAHYLQRYSEYKKKLSFKEWLSQQALPDSMIKSIWGDKKYGYVYNLIKNSTTPGHGADANNFFNALKDLGQKSGIGNPPQVWNAYMTGQLDAEDLIKFETILKKYMPQPSDLDEHAKFLKYWQDKSLFSADVPFDAVHEVDIKYLTAGYSNAGQYWQKYVNGELIDPELDKLLGYKGPTVVNKAEELSNTLKATESKLNISKSSPMTKEGADNYKVNPFYDNADKSLQTNCQTTTFAYECRRQGYDVVALPYLDGNGNPLPGFEAVAKKQTELSYDQSLGWINTKTGKAPVSQLDSALDYSKMDHAQTMAELEKIIGTNGERYSLAINYTDADGKVGAHVLNIDRTDKGTLRIIDNQRGPLDINTWTGKEIDDYFIDTKGTLVDVFRLDDCIPNPEYFNSIVTDASKIKAKNNVTVLPYEKLNGVHKSKIITAAEDAKVPGLINPTTGEINEDIVSGYFTKWKYGLVDSSYLDNLYNSADTANKTVDALDVYKAKLSSKYTEIDDSLHKVVEPIIYKKHGDDTFAEYWHKYIKGSITDPELDDALKAHISAKTPQASKTPPIANGDQYGLDMDVISSKSASAVWKELNQAKAGGGKFWSDITDIANKYGEKPGELWKKYYLTGKLDPDDAAKIEAHLAKIYSKADKADDVSDIAKKWQHVDDVFDASIPSTVLDDMAAKGIMDPQDHWKKYLAGEIKDTDIDHALKGITPPAKAENIAKAPEKTDDIASVAKKEIAKIEKPGSGYYDIYHNLEKIDEDLAIEFNGALLNLKHSEGYPSKLDTLHAYLNGDLKDDKLDEIFTKFYGDKLPSTNPYKEKDLLEIMADPKLQPGQPALEHILNDIGGNYIDYVKNWANGEIIDTKLDELLLGKKVTKVDDVANKTETTIINVLDAVKNKKVSTIWNELKSQGGGIYSQWWKTIGDIGGPYDKKQSAVWDMYLKGQLKDDEKEKIENFLLKHYFNKTDNIIDYSKFGGKEVYDTLKKYDSIDDFLFNVPSAEYDKIVKLFHNNADEVQTAIDEIKKLEKAKAAKATKTAENSEELIKAQEKLKKAQEELEEIKKELAQIPNKTYTGIWKNDVTLADYESKQNTLAAKKQYYYDQIEELDHCIDDPDSWQFKKYGGEEGLNKKIAEYEKYIDDLSEFEVKGKEYLDEKTKIDKKIKQAEKVVTDAQDEVRQLTPVGEAFTQERKDAAVWAKNKTSEYEKVDKYYETVASKVHGSKTSIEHEGYYHYTWGSGPFNEPLYMFRNIDANGYGSKIRGLTSLIEKSSYDKDIWIQSAQNHITIEAFLGIKPGTLSNMTVEEAQQFVGVQNEIPQFLSGAVNKYGGSYNPGNMTINIYCPAGSEVLYVRDDGHFGKNEHEMILQRGGTYKLTKIYKGIGTHNTTEWIVDLELHPEVGYNKVQQ